MINDGTLTLLKIISRIFIMKTLKTGINWIDDVIPEELPLKSTTVIQGSAVQENH